MRPAYRLFAATVPLAAALALLGGSSACSFTVPDFVIDDAVPEQAVAFPLLDAYLAVPAQLRQIQGAGFALVDTVGFDGADFADLTEVGLVAKVRNELDRGATVQVYFLNAEGATLGVLFDTPPSIPAAGQSALDPATGRPAVTRIETKLSASKIALLPEVDRLRVRLAVSRSAPGQTHATIPPDAGVGLQIGLLLR